MKVSIYCNASRAESKKVAVTAILSDGRHRKELRHILETKNYRTAIQKAVVSGLKALKYPHRTHVTIYVPAPHIGVNPEIKALLARTKSWQFRVYSAATELNNKAVLKPSLTGKTRENFTQRQLISRINSYAGKLKDRFDIETTDAIANEDYAEMTVEIYDRQTQKLICALRISAESGRSGVDCECVRCPFPSGCPFYGRLFCHKSRLH